MIFARVTNDGVYFLPAMLLVLILALGLAAGLKRLWPPEPVAKKCRDWQADEESLTRFRKTREACQTVRAQEGSQ